MQTDPVLPSASNELAEACVAMFLPDMPEMSRAGGIVGPEVVVPAGASAHGRLLGAMGRRPQLLTMTGAKKTVVPSWQRLAKESRSACWTSLSASRAGPSWATRSSHCGTPRRGSA